MIDKRFIGIVILLVLSFGSVLAADSYAQNTRLTLEVTNITMRDVFNEIEKKSEYIFFYSDEVNVYTKVVVNATDKHIDEIMKQMLKGTDYTYTVSDRQVFIRPIHKLDNMVAVDVVNQQKTVSGIVSDKTGEPVIGASISIKGSTMGTITDIDGKFTLNVPNGAILIVSYIGMITQEVAVGNNTTLRIELADDVTLVDEVIVVGYGVQRKANLTGSVANVNNQLIEGRPLTSVSAGLQGLLPGVTVAQRSGQPGSDDGTIRIRGTGTMNVNDPMVIVDGVESTINDIDANDISTISVLKDAASASIYGSKAANGVILITTKRGKPGTSVVNYTMNFGWQDITEMHEYASSAEYARIHNRVMIDKGLEPIYSEEVIRKFEDGSEPYNYPDTDWLGLLYTESGFQHQHNISISGGSEAMRYMASIGYQNQGGLIRHTNKDQYNMRLNLDGTPKKNLDTSFSMAYSRIDITEPTNPYTGGLSQIFRQANMISPMVPYKYEDGSYGTISDGNPIAWLDNNATTDKIRHNLQTIASMKYYVLPQLGVKAIGSYKLYFEDSHEMRKGMKYNERFSHGPDELFEKLTCYDRVTGDVLLEYNDSFGKHNLSALGGYHAELYKYKYTQASRKNFPSNSLTDLNAGGMADLLNEGYSRELAMLAWFGRVNYDYAGKYLLEANLRYDASSRFARGNRWGTFPSVSAGWRVSEEAFFASLKDIVTNTKVRASWGKLGNQDLGTNAGFYPTVSTLFLGSQANYPFGGTIKPGAFTRYAANPELKWEETTTWGIGLDFAFLNKITLTLDYYDKTTDGILRVVSTPVTYALSNYFDNIGKVNNRGLEIDLGYRDRLGDVNVSIGGNVSFNRNRILALENEQIIDGDGFIHIYRVGESINSFYGYKAAGLFQSQQEVDNWAKYTFSAYTARPGDIRYINQTDDNVITAADRVVLGSWDPGVTFGFNIGADYKGWDILALFQGAADVYGYLGTEAIGAISGDSAKPAKLWLNSWTPENPGAKYPRVVENLYGVSMPNTSSSFWMQDASYLRLKNLQIGYTFPKQWLTKAGISKLRVYYSGQNILTFTGFLKGWDPEAPNGRGSYYPQTKVHSFGLNVTF